MMDTAAVVVTYNRSELLRKNILCLLNQKDAQCDIYVIDNASTDSTREIVLAFNDARIHYFNTGSNLGGAGGFEWGIRQAVEDGYSFVWVMDDDTFPESRALDELMQASLNLIGKWGALSSAVYWTDGSMCRANRQKKTLFRFVSDKELERGEPVRVKMASFVSLLVKADVIRELGLPYGEYFIWTDDYEYTGRISRHYDVYVVPKSVVVHAMKSNAKINLASENTDRISRYRYVYRNDVHCYRQYGLKGWLYLLAKFSYTVLDVLFHAKNDRLGRLKIVFRGFIDGLSFNPVRKTTHGGGGHRNNVVVVVRVRFRVEQACRSYVEEAAA